MLKKTSERQDFVNISATHLKTSGSGRSLLLCAFPVLVDHRHEERRLRLDVDPVSVRTVGQQDLDGIHDAGYK